MLSDIYYQQRPLIFEPSAPFVRDSETSKEAAESVRKELGPMCRKVRSAIASSRNGLTCSEVEEELDMKHQTASARLRDLQKSGFIEWKINPETGKHYTRKTSSGRNGKVYFFVHNMSTQTCP